MGSIWLDGRPPLDRCKGALEAGSGLGARFVVATASDPQRRRVIDHFALLCEECAKLGMSVVIEFFAYSAVRTIEEAHIVVAASKQENAGNSGRRASPLPFGGIGRIAQADPEPGRYCSRKSATRRPDHRRRPGFPMKNGTIVSMSGFGGLPLLDFAENLPAAIPVEVEVPCKRYAGMAHRERAALAGNAARTLLRSVGSSKVESSS